MKLSLKKVSRTLPVALLVLLADLNLAAEPARSNNAGYNDACFSKSGQAGVEACIDLTNVIGRDLHRLNANARALEELGKPESAMPLYAAAAAYFPDNKRALQGLVRSRANARSIRIITDITPKAADVSPCWTERWMLALKACQFEVKQHAGDTRLQERLGDVARSVGDVKTAQAAYAKSLALQPDNPNLRRKKRALTLLLAGTAPTFATPTPAATELATTATAAAVRPQPSATSVSKVLTDKSANDSTIRQLELLEELKGRNLIAASEYQERRAALLAAAFVATPQTQTNVRYRGLHKGRYLAVVIGNNQYAEFPQLQTAAADADAISDVLRTRYGFEVTKLINANRYEILSALSALRKQATTEDSILLYYAGHGLLDEPAGQGYWLPVDAERGNFAQWISTTDIAAVFAGADAQHALVIADSCFAGTLLRSADATGLDTLQRLAAKRSRTVLTSGGLEPVIDDGNGLHSVFAGALLQALSDNNAVLEASKLFATVRDQVVRNADQTPQYAPMQSARHDGGDFLFIPRTLSDERGTY